MTGRERIMAVLRGGEPDRIPWAPLVDEYFTSSIGGRNHAVGVVEALREIGADVIRRHTHVFDEVYPGIEFATERRGNEELLTIRTPAGDLRQQYVYSGRTKFCKGHMAGARRDIDALKALFEAIRFEPDYESFLKEQAAIGEDGIAAVSCEPTPIQKLLQYEMGVENFTYLLCDYEDEMKELMEIIHLSNLRLLKVLVESPAEVIVGYEDTSTTVLSAAWYRNHCSARIDEYADAVHRSSKIYITHMCGKLKGFANMIAENRMDGIDSVCPPTTGDLAAGEALKAFEGKFVIGGIEPVALQRMTAEETADYTLNVLRDAAPGRGFILSTGDATAWGTPMENLKTVTETVKRHGKYPMKF